MFCELMPHLFWLFNLCGAGESTFGSAQTAGVKRDDANAVRAGLYLVPHTIELVSQFTRAGFYILDIPKAIELRDRTVAHSRAWEHYQSARSGVTHDAIGTVNSDDTIRARLGAQAILACAPAQSHRLTGDARPVAPFSSAALAAGSIR